MDVRQVGRELGVRYVLEGGVRKAGSRLRITAQLIEAETGAHLWADRFDGALEPRDLMKTALRFHGCKRVHNADEIMSEMVSNGFVVAKWPSSGGRGRARTAIRGLTIPSKGSKFKRC